MEVELERDGGQPGLNDSIPGGFFWRTVTRSSSVLAEWRFMGGLVLQSYPWRMFGCIWNISSYKIPIKVLHRASPFGVVLAKELHEGARGSQIKRVLMNCGDRVLSITALLAGGAKWVLVTRPKIIVGVERRRFYPLTNLHEHTAASKPPTRLAASKSVDLTAPRTPVLTLSY